MSRCIGLSVDWAVFMNMYLISSKSIIDGYRNQCVVIFNYKANDRHNQSVKIKLLGINGSLHCAWTCHFMRIWVGHNFFLNIILLTSIDLFCRNTTFYVTYTYLLLD